MEAVMVAAEGMAVQGAAVGVESVGGGNQSAPCFDTCRHSGCRHSSTGPTHPDGRRSRFRTVSRIHHPRTRHRGNGGRCHFRTTRKAMYHQAAGERRRRRVRYRHSPQDARSPDAQALEPWR